MARDGMSGPRPSWLLLDVGGVLEIVDDDIWPGRFRARWAGRLGLSEAEFETRAATADLPDTSVRAGVQEAFWSAYGDALGASQKVVQAMRADFWDEYCGVADERLLSALRGLHGVRLAILSNSSDGARDEEERRFGFSALFDPICYSHESGFSKPDPRAFEAALQRMGASASDVLFVDNRAPNVEAARRLGLRSILHVDIADTIARIHLALDG